MWAFICSIPSQSKALGLFIFCRMQKVVRHPQARMEDEMHVVKALWRLLRVQA